MIRIKSFQNVEMKLNDATAGNKIVNKKCIESIQLDTDLKNDLDKKYQFLEMS